jgi:putative ABC transport system ATP-binding protein
MAGEIMAVRAENLRKEYKRGAETIVAVNSVNLEIAHRAFVAITGPSGAGKSTLLQLIGAMDTPTGGTLTIDGQTVGGSDRDLTRLRREKIGFVFQHFGLLPTLTVAENVALAATKVKGKEIQTRVAHLLERVGLEHRTRHRPTELSGGEMQRVAIARALVNSPALLLADEPTGNLDSQTGESITRLLHEIRHDSGVTVVVVTHNEALAQAADYRLTLRDGRLQ